jgi:alkylation response protein AidB-like acyl-CoA dehydrogenase
VISGAVQYANERIQFNTQPLLNLAVRSKLAEMAPAVAQMKVFLPCC